VLPTPPSQSFEFCLLVCTTNNSYDELDIEECHEESCSWTKTLTMAQLKAVKPHSPHDLMQLDDLKSILAISAEYPASAAQKIIYSSRRISLTVKISALRNSVLAVQYPDSKHNNPDPDPMHNNSSSLVYYDKWENKVNDTTFADRAQIQLMQITESLHFCFEHQRRVTKRQDFIWSVTAVVYEKPKNGMV
jgi:hypothetical protein